MRVYSLTPPEDWRRRGAGSRVEAARLPPLPRGNAPAFHGTLLSFEVDARGEAQGSALCNCMRLQGRNRRRAYVFPTQNNIDLVVTHPSHPPSPLLQGGKTRHMQSLPAADTLCAVVDGCLGKSLSVSQVFRRSRSWRHFRYGTYHAVS